MALYLIRHGETEANVARVFQHPDVPLSARGRDQARRLAERLADAGIAAILSSDFTRAAMTAEALQSTTGAPLHHDALLQERHFGELRGQPYASAGPDPFAEDYQPPGGESVRVFHARVARAWAAVEAAARRTDGHLAVVTHGLVCAALVTRHLALGPELDSPLSWRNTSLTIARSGERDDERWRVELLDCTRHLA